MAHLTESVNGAIPIEYRRMVWSMNIGLSNTSVWDSVVVHDGQVKDRGRHEKVNGVLGVSVLG